MTAEASNKNHVETAMKSLRTVSRDEALWEREWVTIELFCNELGAPLEPGHSVLDVGCGGREMSWGASTRSLVYRGLDISDGNFESDPFPVESETIDVVVALALIEHLHNPDNFMKESLRVLKHGGILILSTPNWRYSWKTFYNNPAHVQPYTDVSIKVLAAAYGFTNVQVVPGLRVKPRWMYFSRFAFSLAKSLPFRAGKSWIPEQLSGKATSLFLFAQVPMQQRDPSPRFDSSASGEQ